MKFEKMPHTSACPDCKSWARHWESLVERGLIIPGAVYRNNYSGNLLRNLKKPYGHCVGHESISGGKFFWSIYDKFAMANTTTQAMILHHTRASLLTWWMEKIKWWGFKKFTTTISRWFSKNEPQSTVLHMQVVLKSNREHQASDQIDNGI